MAERWKRLRQQGTWVALIVAAGLVARLVHFLRDPSVWHDEAALMVNVLGKNFRELLGPLIFCEAAPPLFLWIERAMSLIFGDGTFSLRFIPMLAGCGTVVLTAPLARRLLRPEVVPWAVLLVAGSNRLLWHACEAKPYAVDALLFVALAVVFFETRAWSWAGRIALFSLMAPLYVFLSYPGCFLYGGLLVALVPELWRRRSAPVWAGYAFLGAVVGISFTLLMWGPIRAQRGEAMDACWLDQFPNWGRPWTVPAWTVFSSLDLVRYCFEPTGHVLALLAAVGVVQLWRGGYRQEVLLVGTPLALTLLASYARSYPYGGARVEVFLAPALAVFVAAGGAGLVEWCRSRFRPGAVVVVGLLLAVPCLAAFRTVIPWPRAECGPAAEFVLNNRRPTDPVISGNWEYWYYFRRLGEHFTPAEHVGRLPDSRLWLVKTGNSAEERELWGKDNVFPGEWDVVERRDFFRTSVYLICRKGSQITPHTASLSPPH